jgi:hypothetical protein
MFADAPQRYCDYAVTGPDGEALDVARLGLQRNYWGNPLGVGVGFHPPPSVDQFGAVASEEDVRDWVGERLKDFPELKSVEVVQTVVGPVDALRVGEVESNRWRIDNPHFQGPVGR